MKILAPALVLTMLLVALAPARADAPPNSIPLCYDDPACRTNLFVNVDDLWLLGDFIVCTDHILTSVAGSSTCPAIAPGVYYACAPASTGYCNATLLTWKDIRYAVRVTATVGAAALVMGGVGLHSENWTAVRDGVTQSSFVGDASSTAVSVPADGQEHVVEFLKTTSEGPGIGNAPAPTPSGSTAPTPQAAPAQPPTFVQPPPAATGDAGGVDVIVARLPVGAAAAAASPTSKIGLALLGLVMVVMGDADLGRRLRIPKHKPRAWMAVTGSVLLILAIASLVM